MAQLLPFKITIAPFPEGFQGDMDETFQQAYQNTTALVESNFITGLVLPPGSTLPTSDQGPIAMDGTWYFFDPVSGQYLPQTAPFKPAKNAVRNSSYQVAQTGNSFTVGAGVMQTFDMCLTRATLANVLAIAATVGPPAGADNDLVLVAIQFTVGPTLVPTLGSTDIYTHEHLVEGCDIVRLQGQQCSLSFSVNATVSGVYSVYLTNGARDQSYVANFTIGASQVNTWVRVKIPNIPPFPTVGTWSYGEGVTGLYIGFPMGVGSQFQTATLNAWHSGFFAGSTQNVNMLTVVNNRLQISALKLEAAPAPSYYQAVPFPEEFSSVLRYYYTSFNYQSLSAGVFIRGIAPQNGQINFSELFPIRMCKSPLVVPYSYLTGNAGYVTDVTTAVDIPLASLTAKPKGVCHQAVAATLVRNGNTHGTTVIDGLSATSDLGVGMLVTASPSIALTGNSHATTTIDGLSSTSGLVLGMSVDAPYSLDTIGSIHSGTTIDGIPSTNGICLGMQLATGDPVSLAGTSHSSTLIDGMVNTAGILVGMTVSSPTGFVYYGNSHSSTTIDNMSSVEDLLVGMLVQGSGIPSGAYITSIGPSVITISAAATSTIPSLPLQFFNGIATGTVVTAINTGNSLSVSPALSTSMANIPLTFGYGFPYPATVTGVNSSTSITISAATVATIANVPLHFYYGIQPGTRIVSIGSNSIGISIPASYSITGLPLILSFGIHDGTTVTAILSGSSIAISPTATSQLSGTPLTFAFPKGDSLLAYITADARLS